MRVLIKEPAKAAKITEIDNTLEALQEAVGGYIEVVPVPNSPGVVYICNEEGKLKGYSPNVLIPGDVICGTVLVAGVDGEEFCSLSDETVEAMRQLGFLGLTENRSEAEDGTSVPRRESGGGEQDASRTRSANSFRAGANEGDGVPEKCELFGEVEE